MSHQRALWRGSAEEARSDAETRARPPPSSSDLYEHFLLIFQLTRPPDSHLNSNITMLINETHQDVGTSADGKGSMRTNPRHFYPRHHTPIKHFQAYTSTTPSSRATPKQNSLGSSSSARSTKVRFPSSSPPPPIDPAPSNRSCRALRPPDCRPRLHRRRALFLPRIHGPRTPRIRRPGYR